jgi:hypothetical protein
MATRMAAWRSRLEVVALLVVIVRFVDFGGDVTTAVAWGYGSLGDWSVRLSGYPMVFPGLVLLVSLAILVVTRILYSWPKGTPMKTAFLTSAGALTMGTVGVVCSFGGVVTQLARIGRAAEYSLSASAFLAGALYSLAGIIACSVVVILAIWLLRELMRDRPARLLTEPENAPPPQF